MKTPLLLPLLLLLSTTRASFIGSPLLGPLLQDALVANKAINDTSSLFGGAYDAVVAAKYGNATAAAWHRLLSGSASVSAVAGPALGGDITCFVGLDGGVAGLKYGPALVCAESANAVSIPVGDGIVEYVDIYLGTDAKIAGLTFVVRPVAGTPSTAYPCGTLKGPHAWLGKQGQAVGALGGGCSGAPPPTAATVAAPPPPPPVRRRRLFQSSTNGTLSAIGFTAVLVPAPPTGTPSSGGYGGGGFVFG